MRLGDLARAERAQQAPCVLVLDELEALHRRRTIAHLVGSLEIPGLGLGRVAGNDVVPVAQVHVPDRLVRVVFQNFSQRDVFERVHGIRAQVGFAIDDAKTTDIGLERAGNRALALVRQRELDLARQFPVLLRTEFEFKRILLGEFLVRKFGFPSSFQLTCTRGTSAPVAFSNLNFLSVGVSHLLPGR